MSDPALVSAVRDLNRNLTELNRILAEGFVRTAEALEQTADISILQNAPDGADPVKTYQRTKDIVKLAKEAFNDPDAQ